MSGSLIPYFHSEGLNCAESVLRLLIERGVIDLPVCTIRMMSGFGGGMQRGLTCGAVIAGAAAIGSVTGRTEPEESRARSAQAIREFLAAFEARFHAIDCAALAAGYAMKSPQMYAACTEYVLYAADIATSIIHQAKEG